MFQIDDKTYTDEAEYRQALADLGWSQEAIDTTVEGIKKNLSE
jgi:Holliday junction resolvasome RuvABC DNA-binding subunit